MSYFRLFIRRGCQTAMVFLCLPFIFGTNSRGTGDPRSAALPVYISTAFENASPLQWSVDSGGQVDIALLYDHERYTVNRSNSHWLFQVQAKKGMDLVLVLRNFDNYWNGHLAAAITDRTPACISVDGRHWITMPASRLPGNRLRIPLHMPADTVYVSETEPYRISDLERFEQAIEADPLVHISAIGHTVEGRPLEMIRVGDSLAPHRVLIRARAHGYEAGGNWVVEGLVRRLLTGESRKMLRHFCLYIMPMANKDAVARGRSRFNSKGMDLNRHWDKEADMVLAPENNALESWLDTVIRQGWRPDLLIDLHNDAEGHLHLCSPGSENPGYLPHMRRLDSLLRRFTWYTEGAIGGESRTPQPGSSIADGLLYRYGIEGLVFELNWEWAAGLGRPPLGKDWQDLGSGLAAVLDSYFGASAGEPDRQTLPANAAAAEDTLRLDSTLVGVSTVVTGLEVPWELAWGNDGCIWYTEQTGRITRWDPRTGRMHRVLQLRDLYRKRLGLLSMALDMPHHPWVFLNYLFLRPDSSIWAKVVRYTYAGDSLRDPVVLIQWHAHAGHNGSRIAIARDGTLMIATGDITRDSIAQDTRTPNGKILRLDADGSIPMDNPFPGSPVWATGFRVPQGLVFSPTGRLYSAEHGDATDDEVNLIRKGGNYGFPYVTGYCDQPAEKAYCRLHGVREPLRAWTPTIAPAGIDYYGSGAIPEWKNALLLVTLKTQSLRVLSLDAAGRRITRERIYLQKKYGRLRDLCVSPAGDIYIGTSNWDWNPPEHFPVSGDDRIIRIRRIGVIPRGERTGRQRAGASGLGVAAGEPAAGRSKASPELNGVELYTAYCASCHKTDGKGVAGSFPPLAGNPLVAGETGRLIGIVLHGLSGPVSVNGEGYDQSMPSFSFLKDDQLAAILTFIRSRWNASGPIRPGMIAEDKKKRR